MGKASQAKKQNAVILSKKEIANRGLVPNIKAPKLLPDQIEDRLKRFEAEKEAKRVRRDAMRRAAGWIPK